MHFLVMRLFSRDLIKTKVELRIKVFTVFKLSQLYIASNCIAQ